MVNRSASHLFLDFWWTMQHLLPLSLMYPLWTGCTLLSSCSSPVIYPALSLWCILNLILVCVLVLYYTPILPLYTSKMFNTGLAYEPIVISHFLLNLKIPSPLIQITRVTLNLNLLLELVCSLGTSSVLPLLISLSRHLRHPSPNLCHTSILSCTCRVNLNISNFLWILAPVETMVQVEHLVLVPPTMKL